MKKTYSDKELEQIANKAFKNYTNAEQLFMTVDGQAFLNENRARLNVGAKGKIVKVINQNFGVTEDQDTIPTKAKELVKFAKTASLEVSEAQLALETSKDEPRSTVIDALKARISELNTDA